MGVKESHLPLEYTSGVCRAEVAGQNYDFSGDLLRMTCLEIV